VTDKNDLLASGKERLFTLEAFFKQMKGEITTLNLN